MPVARIRCGHAIVSIRDTGSTLHAYQEFSDGTGSSHTFYEARVEEATPTLRYGRTGTDGQTQVKTFPTPEAALRA